MTFVTVFRRVPPPVIGMVGVLPERTFAAFENDLDWLETTGVLVERFEPGHRAQVVAPGRAARLVLEKEGDRCLPLILVDGILVSRGVHPTRARLARLVGRGRRGRRLAVARQLAAIGAAAALGADDEVRRQAARAGELGIGATRVRAAIDAGAALRQGRRPAPAA